MVKIKASTISVIHTDSTTTCCYLDVNGETCNVTLRFDRGDTAEICGYPMDWGVHDVNVDYYNCESPTYAEIEDSGMDMPETYISADIEKSILKKMRTSIVRQFKSKDWHDSCSKIRQTEIIKLIDNAISQL